MIFDELAFAVTHCALSPADFAALSPEEWRAIAMAQLEKEEFENRRNWETARVIAYTSVLPHMSVRKSITDFMPFAWDAQHEQADSKPPSIDERKELLKKFSG